MQRLNLSHISVIFNSVDEVIKNGISNKPVEKYENNLTLLVRDIIHSTANTVCLSCIFKSGACIFILAFLLKIEAIYIIVFKSYICPYHCYRDAHIL